MTDQKQIEDGGPAFARPESHLPNGNSVRCQSGMSLRNYFAATIDVPWNSVLDALDKKFPGNRGEFTLDQVVKYRAEVRYLEADAMIAASKEPNG